MSTAAVTLLRAHLNQLALKGRTTVALNDGPRQALKSLGKAPPATLRPAPEAPRIAVPSPAQTQADVEPPRTVRPPVTNSPRVAPPQHLIEAQGTTNAEKLASLIALAQEDPRPRALGSLRETLVFSVGNPEARLMFVGEAPGAEEERQHEPFVGPAGQLLTKIIENAMGLRRSDVYISNICKFRPGMGDGQGSRNRPPTPEEMNACVSYIQTEIRIIRPQVIVALGATAATGLGVLGAVGRLRSRFHEVDGIPTMVTYHPSYIIRQEQEGGGTIARRQVWEDMLMVMEKLGMTITDKQRGFFKPKA